MMNAVFGVVLLLVLVGGGLTPFPARADVFCDNLIQVAATLPKDTSSSPAHFAATTFGYPPDVVYALALCRGDVVNDSACGECVASALDELLNGIPPPRQQQCYKASYEYDELCALVYSEDDILTSSNSNTTEGNGAGDGTPYTKWDEQSWGTRVDDATVIVGLLQELLVATAQAAASTTAPRRFAMDSGTTLPWFYSLAQCTPDMSAGNCLACLSRLVGMVNSTIALRIGGQIHAIRCHLRYEANMFYNTTPMLIVRPPSTPAPTPTTTVKHKKHMSKFWAIPIVVIPLAAAAAAYLHFIFCSSWLRQTYRKGIGYMAPEYACEGLFSIKSDVFSFSVLVLEILGGKRNSGSSECGNFINLLGYAWQLYKEGRWSELIDASLVPIRDSAEVMRCMNIALLCVQEKAADRPTMLDVVAMLSSKTMVLVEPKHPGYFNLRVGNEEVFSATLQSSINDMTISVTTGR
ncbi:cysteine-rich receptor-like protein kinase 15 [Panicum miliaceum]|uniref:Cysteine-rich receptor-like protein kinase 15 n=1 Tax=Panicum miliaceum TaxID=4540 RepID=A0A3L6RAH9_PANMI|nr:cysteine-rich receptor-like protein kinase 15 [Panicum miliaceum]